MLLRLETPTERDDLERISEIFDLVEDAEEIAADALDRARRSITAAKLAARRSRDLTRIDRKRVPIAIDERFRDFIVSEGIVGAGAEWVDPGGVQPGGAASPADAGLGPGPLTVADRVRGISVGEATALSDSEVDRRVFG